MRDFIKTSQSKFTNFNFAELLFRLPTSYENKHKTPCFYMHYT